MKINITLVREDISRGIENMQLKQNKRRVACVCPLARCLSRYFDTDRIAISPSFMYIGEFMFDTPEILGMWLWNFDNHILRGMEFAGLKPQSFVFELPNEILPLLNEKAVTDILSDSKEIEL